MIGKFYPLAVDFERSVGCQEMKFVKGDIDSCGFAFTFTQAVTGLSVFVTFVLPSGTPYIEEATITGDYTATLQLASGELSEVGVVRCQVAVYGTTERLTNTVRFGYEVTDDDSSGAVAGSDQYPILLQLIVDCTAINDAEVLRVIAEQGRVDEEIIRVASEDDRILEENARVLAEGDATSGRVKAEIDRELAEGVRGDNYLLAEGARDASYGLAETARDDSYALAEGVRDGLYTAEEATRNLGETGRVDAEALRVIAEGDALSGRVKAEADRVLAENARGLAIGTQTYTEQNYVTDSETLTKSIDALDIQVNDSAELISTNTSDIADLKTKIYGVAWNKLEFPNLVRTHDAVSMTAKIGIGTQTVINDFDTADIYKDITTVTDTLGNVFVRIPKFYIKKSDDVATKSWAISTKKWDASWYLPWCFWDFTNSRELDYFDYGKYNAYLNGTKLESKADTYPTINQNIVDFRTYAQNNNVGGLLGYQQLDIHAIDVLRTLFFIEFGTLNSQAIMQGFTAGQFTATHVATVAESATNRIIIANAFADLYRVGQTISIGTTQGGNQIFYGRTITAIDVYDASNKAISFDGTAVNIALGNMVYNTGWKSGFSSGITASSGCIVANDGKYPYSYRGIENPFGSVWQFVDGVNITDRQAWVCKDANSYTSNVFASPYEVLGYVNGSVSGSGPVAMGYDSNYPFAEFPTDVTGGSTSKHYCDYYYQDAGARIALFGGSWISGSYAGLSNWYLTYASSSAFITFAGRLMKKQL